MSEESFFGHPKETHMAVIEDMRKYLKESEAREMKDNIDYIEKLQFLTLEMKRELLTNFPPQRLGRALKLSSRELVIALLRELSSSVKAEILHVLQQKLSIGNVMKEQEALIKLCRRKESSGKFVFDPGERLV